MKIVLSPDSFKESLSAIQVCDAMARGVFAVFPDADIVKIPLADGGEGTVCTLVAATGGALIIQDVVGPLDDPVKAEFGILGNTSSAVIEMAAASGLPLVPRDKRNPLYTTTFGTGQLITAALDRNVKKIIIGIGGSATNDCGTGMAQALGVQFFENTSVITAHMTGSLMEKVTRVDISQIDSRIDHVAFQVACDVDNPLLGPSGASHVYGPQKGATPDIADKLEQNMAHIIRLIEQETRHVRDIPGAGAAGGLGAGLMAFLNADLVSGIDTVLNVCHFEEQIRDADLILTGEGKIDEQSAMGKTIAGIVRRAKKYNVPVIAIGGAVLENAESLYDKGLTSMFSICDKPMSLGSAFENAALLVEKTTERIVRLFRQKQ